jgi:hypothetical protein
MEKIIIETDEGRVFEHGLIEITDRSQWEAEVLINANLFIGREDKAALMNELTELIKKYAI